MTRKRPPIHSSSANGERTSIAKRPHISQEGRQRLSEIARQRWRDGELGQNKGSKQAPPKMRSTKKRRVTARVAEAAREKKNAQAIIDVFKDGVHSSQPIHIRLKAAEAWMKAEQDDAKLRLKEADSENQQRDRDELLTILSTRLTTGPAALLLRRQIEENAGITDAEIVIDGHADDV